MRSTSHNEMIEFRRPVTLTGKRYRVNMRSKTNGGIMGFKYEENLTSKTVYIEGQFLDNLWYIHRLTAEKTDFYFHVNMEMDVQRRFIY